MEVFTAGFTQKSAAEFFGTLQRAGIRRLVDVRLNNVSQLAGFTKRDDLAYFLRAICQADYHHELLLAPSPELFDAYRKQHGPWDVFERGFLGLMAERQVEQRLDRALFAGPTVLLCSEPTAEHCHRRLAVEYLARHWGDIEPVHL